MSARVLAFGRRLRKGTSPVVEAIRSMRFQAVRCTSCGETRWSLFSAAAPESTCELCSGEMVIERRRPGKGPRWLPVERRSAGPGLRNRNTPLLR
jgi:ribosomal protein S27E